MLKGLFALVGIWVFVIAIFFWLVMKVKATRLRRWRALRLLWVIGVLAFIVPLTLGAMVTFGEWSGLSDRRYTVSGSSGQAPDPASTQHAVVQIYASRAARWRGAISVHTWIAIKPSNADHFTRIEVWGWEMPEGARMLRRRRGGADDYFHGYRPDKLVDLRGEGVDEIIEQIEAAVTRYVHANSFRIWPGPNSNTFTATIAREVPALRLDMPPNAVGKDYLPEGRLLAITPSGTGIQVSVFGLAGILLGLHEGIEINLLGLTVGLDLWPPALKLPGIGRLP